MRSALSWDVLVCSRQTGQESLCEELGHGWLTHVAPPTSWTTYWRILEHQARANSLAQSGMPVSFNRTLNLSLLPCHHQSIQSDLRLTGTSVHLPISSEERNWAHNVLGVSESQTEGVAFSSFFLFG